MVYCGQPSRGCQMCRTRRIKCDETKPTCNQCAKSRRQCPGYKDDFDLVLRNETSATERRAQRASKKAVLQRSSSSSSRKTTTAGQDLPSPPLSSSSSSSGEISPLALIPAIQVSTETVASCHFLSNFVLVPRQGSTRGFMDYLIPLMTSSDGSAGAAHLQHAFNACALASLSNTVTSNGVSLPEKAYNEYAKALNATNTALRDPEAWKSDAALAAVLLLGMFENITAQQLGDMNWGSHIEGAIQIVKARGRKQLRTKVGLQLFIAVRTQCIIHALTSGKAPAMGADWWLGEDAVHDQHAAACQRLNLKASELRAEVMDVMTSSLSRTPDAIDLILGLMRRSQSLDEELAAWMKSLPENWAWRTLCWQGPVLPEGEYANAEVFPGRVDVYNDFWIASMWNMARTARLVLSSLTVRCAAWVCSPVDYRTTPEYATAARICADNIADILASVPYHLGWHTRRREAFPDDEALSGFACGDDDDGSLKGLAGYFLTWPLATVMSQDYTTDNQRAWVQGRLKYIGDGMGVRYAHILSQLKIRLPSMLIRRDGLMAQPYPMAHNFEKLLSAKRAPPPSPGYTMNPLEQREAMRKEDVDKRRAELIAKATGASAGESAKMIAKKLLSV
ncbi:hypothetical protein B0H66DRAFT_474976 [Apodospora peruviana]|uniref:Zn(2)-C6 fungal-type domain-containing protein n=1 Tax=Apodospora peruviana TaxID=516989 RepID=A0AAE0ID51_9PEZI|nr:hypothetical protein B0H66DRAFT_474976 [Apodospora peruviana]